MFGNGRRKVERDIEDLQTSVSKMQQRVGAIELGLETIRTHLQSLRGLVNRKLGAGAETKELNSPDGLDELRGLR